MAQIDLRRADVYFRDGFTAAGAVNQPVTAPANGDTTLTVDGFTKALPVGASFTVAGSTGTYTITSTTGGSTPTQIHFTPALSTAAGLPADNAVVTVSGNVLKVKIGEGNLTFSAKRNMEYVRDKRSITAGFVRTGDDEPMEVKIDAIWEFLSSDSGDPPTIEEALTQAGAASGWVTSGADPCEPYAVDIEVIYTPPCSTVKSERILLREYRWEALDHDLKAGTIATSGKCKDLLPDVSRVTAPVAP
jgi:hypothetical protein